MWDYIFAGLKNEHRCDQDFGDMYYQDDYYESKSDPLINLDFLCLAMIENIRPQVYHEEMDVCLEVFFHYPEIKNASKILNIAAKIEKSIRNGTECTPDLLNVMPVKGIFDVISASKR